VFAGCKAFSSLIFNFVIVPGACRDLKASSIASEAITLSWRPPVTDAAVIKYKVVNRNVFLGAFQ